MSGGERGGAPGALRVGLPALAVTALLGMLAGFAWGVADEPLYSAESSVVLAPGTADGTGEEDLLRYAEIGSGREVATVAAGLLGGDVAGADLLSEISVSAAPDGASIEIEATSAMPDFAAAAADAYADALVEVAADRGSGEPLQLGAAAVLPDDPTEDRSGLGWALAGLLAGLLAGSILTVLLGRARGAGHRRKPRPPKAAKSAKSAKSDQKPSWLEDALGAPVLAGLEDPDPLRSTPSTGEPLDLDDSRIEAYREAAGSLGLDSDDAPRTIGVVAVGADGDAVAAALGLGVAAAEQGLRVIVVEADLAAPSLAARLGVSPAPGLRDYLDRAATPREVMRTLPFESGASGRLAVVCVPAGEQDGSTAGVAGRRFDGLVERLPRVYDLVLFAAPPVLADADALIVAAATEGMVAVAPEAESARAEVRRAAQMLRTVRLLGTIATR